jgi:hypothetical protein
LSATSAKIGPYPVINFNAAGNSVTAVPGGNFYKGSASFSTGSGFSILNAFSSDNGKTITGSVAVGTSMVYPCSFILSSTQK